MYSDVSIVYANQIHGVQYVMSTLGLKTVNSKIKQTSTYKNIFIRMFPPSTEITRYMTFFLGSIFKKCHLFGGAVSHPFDDCLLPKVQPTKTFGENQRKLERYSKGMARGASGWYDQMLLVDGYTLGERHRNSPIFWRRQKRFEVRL